jgi:single-stranded DNA-binding protein
MSNVVRHTTCVILFLMLAGCLPEQQELASEEAKQKAMKDYIGCLEAAAAKMDDGKSDAMTVATAIKPLCAGEFAQSVKLSGSGLSPYARNLFEEKVQANQLELATTAVLDHRRGPSTTKAGKPFVTATIRVKDGEATQWWNIVAFSESAQLELMRLSEGEAMAVQGAMRIEEYEKDGQKRVSLSIVADHVLALRQPQKPPAARSAGHNPNRHLFHHHPGRVLQKARARGRGRA